MNATPPLDRIRIVLSHPSHPGNIGAAARAMKTMGLARLYLVKPKTFPDQQAVAMATGAVLGHDSPAHLVADEDHTRAGRHGGGEC